MGPKGSYRSRRARWAAQASGQDGSWILPDEVFQACPAGRRPRRFWRDDVSLLWERLGIPLDDLEEVARDREV